MQTIFCHGWGFNYEFFKPLMPYFPQGKFLDLGYIEPLLTTTKPANIVTTENLPQIAEAQDNLIGIGHSLGLIKLLQTKLKFQALIGIYGFTNFTANESVNIQGLTTMHTAFKNNPQATIQAFYKKCGIKDKLSFNSIAIPKLQADMELLYKDFSTMLPNIPILIFANLGDPIVHPKVIKHNFAAVPNCKVVFLQGKNHILSQQHVTAIYTYIKEFCYDTCC